MCSGWSTGAAKSAGSRLPRTGSMGGKLRADGRSGQVHPSRPTLQHPTLARPTVPLMPRICRVRLSRNGRR